MRRLTLLVALATSLCLACGDSSDETTATGGTGGGGTGGGSGGGSGGSDPYPNVARIAVPATFEPQTDGTYQLPTGLELFDVTQAFYDHHGDDYDFILVWTDFRVADIWQFALTTRVDIQGIGQDIIYSQHYNWPFDWYHQAGSDGQLQAVVLMNDPALFDSAAFTEQEILTHEVGHRWGASVMPPPSEPDPLILLDGAKSHWAIVASIGGPSALGYGHMTDNGNGTFTSTRISPLGYAPLELYTMGLIPPDDPSLAGMFYVRDPTGFDPPTNSTGQPWTIDSLNAGGSVTFSGERVNLTVADIVAALGPRTPAHPATQTEFRFAFVLVCDSVAGCSDQTLGWVDDTRVAWEGTFHQATGARASADTVLGP